MAISEFLRVVKWFRTPSLEVTVHGIRFGSAQFSIVRKILL